MWIGKWSSAGTQVWTQRLGEPDVIDDGAAVRVGANGELFVLGTLDIGEAQRLVLARLDPETGDVLWSDEVAGVRARDLARTPAGKLGRARGQTLSVGPRVVELEQRRRARGLAVAPPRSAKTLTLDHGVGNCSYAWPQSTNVPRFGNH
jgi:hypothetical protein